LRDNKGGTAADPNPTDWTEKVKAAITDLEIERQDFITNFVGDEIP
jgi:hypothetical protein